MSSCFYSSSVTNSKPQYQVPPTLLGTEASGFPKERFPIAQYEISNFKNFNYLILDWKTRTAGLVDPQKGLQSVFKDLEENGFQLEWAIVTHSHWDHVAGLKEVSERYPNCGIAVHPGEEFRIKKEIDLFSKRHVFMDGEIFKIGELPVKVMHTPGHSAGECCLLIEHTPPLLLTGDTLFLKECGRTDLETGSDDELFESMQKIKALNPSTIILPGHHYTNECANTLEGELEVNGCLKAKTSAELAAL